MERALDVSELEPPEPLERTLAAADALAPGDFLRMTHRRYPCLLEDQLTVRGFRCEILGDDQSETTESFIWRDGDAAAETAARKRMADPGLRNGQD